MCWCTFQNKFPMSNHNPTEDFGIYFDENILIFLENSYVCRLLKTLGDNFRSPHY